MKSFLQSSLVKISFVSIVLGLASGVIGGALISSSLSKDLARIREETQPLRTDESFSKRLSSSYAEAVARVSATTSSSVATVYLKSNKGAYGFTRASALATGIVVTSDGWVALAFPLSVSQEQLMVEIQRQLYPVTLSVFDHVTNVTFLKLQATNLSVVGFGHGFQLHPGENVFVSADPNTILPTSVRAHVWPQGVLVSSEFPSRRLLLATDSLEEGDLVFDLSASLVGFVTKKDSERFVLPLEDVLPALNSLLESKAIHRAALGIQYLDIAHAIDPQEKFTRTLRAGAYVTGRPAVRRGSAAANAGLSEGDILISLDGRSIDEQHGLDELIAMYKPGDSVSITFDRLGEKKTITVILGEEGK